MSATQGSFASNFLLKGHLFPRVKMTCTKGSGGGIGKGKEVVDTYFMPALGGEFPSALGRTLGLIENSRGVPRSEKNTTAATYNGVDENVHQFYDSPIRSFRKDPLPGRDCRGGKEEKRGKARQNSVLGLFLFFQVGEGAGFEGFGSERLSKMIRKGGLLKKKRKAGAQVLWTAKKAS